MAGGMAHTDTFDPKKYTPYEKGIQASSVLSTFKSLPTALDGIHFSEGLQSIGNVMNEGTLIRSYQAADLGFILHSRHQYHWHTCYEPPQTVAAPHFGSWIANQLGPKNPVIPAFIDIGQRFTVGEARDGGDWVVNGTKHFISGADHADFIIVFIATGEDQTKDGPKKRITAFLVDRGAPGFIIRPGYNSVSHRGYKNLILEFDDCRLPDSQVLGEVDGGFAVMNEWQYATRITVATMAVGRARRVYDYALNYPAERKQFGQPIGNFQGVSFHIDAMITEIDAADYLTLASAWRLDQGLPANRPRFPDSADAPPRAMIAAHEARTAEDVSV
jgi:hypothetical protein